MEEMTTDKYRIDNFVIALAKHWLTPKDEFIICKIHQDRYSQRKIADMLNISPQRVSQIRKNAEAIIRIKAKTADLIPEDISKLSNNDFYNAMGFSVRIKNVFKRNNISNIHDLCKLSYNELLSFKNISRKSVNYVQDEVARWGYKLRELFP